MYKGVKKRSHWLPGAQSNLPSQISRATKDSKKVAKLDVFTTNSLNSQIYNYKRPKFNEIETTIIEARNPIVEKFVTNFISNDTIFNNSEKIKIITGIH